jgi:hypothetical protein
MMATQEFVVPRSMPMTSPEVLFKRAEEALRKPRRPREVELSLSAALAAGATRTIRDNDIFRPITEEVMECGVKKNASKA